MPPDKYGLDLGQIQIVTVGKLKLREGEEGKGWQVFIKFDRALMCNTAEHNISQDITASYFSQKLVPTQDFKSSFILVVL